MGASTPDAATEAGVITGEDTGGGEGCGGEVETIGGTAVVAIGAAGFGAAAVVLGKVTNGEVALVGADAAAAAGGTMSSPWMGSP